MAFIIFDIRFVPTFMSHHGLTYLRHTESRAAFCMPRT
jgi:hypothetical protein